MNFQMLTSNALLRCNVKAATSVVTLSTTMYRVTANPIYGGIGLAGLLVSNVKQEVLYDLQHT